MATTRREQEPRSKRFLDTQAAAEVLGFAPFTLRKWRHQGAGKGPRYFKIGGRVRYSPDDLEDFAQRHPRD